MHFRSGVSRGYFFDDGGVSRGYFFDDGGVSRGCFFDDGEVSRGCFLDEGGASYGGNQRHALRRLLGRPLRLYLIQGLWKPTASGISREGYITDFGGGSSSTDNPDNLRGSFRWRLRCLQNTSIR